MARSGSLSWLPTQLPPAKAGGFRIGWAARRVRCNVRPFWPKSLRPITEAQGSAIRRVALRSPTTVLDTVLDHAQSTRPSPADHQSGRPSAPLPSTPDSSEPSVPDVSEGSNEEANWVVVIRGATEHSGPSVSAPTVRYYPVGTELHLIGYEQGWFQVFDPVTSQRGWIYEKYYLQAIRGPGQVIALQEPAKPQQKWRLHM